MTSSAQSRDASADALRAILANPGDTLVGLDFDGTLAPIVDDPEQAYANPAAVAALGRLGRRVGAVVVITGRPARTAVRARPLHRDRRTRVDGGDGSVRRGALGRRDERLPGAARAAGHRRGGRGAAEASWPRWV